MVFGGYHRAVDPATFGEVRERQSLVQDGRAEGELDVAPSHFLRQVRDGAADNLQAGGEGGGGEEDGRRLRHRLLLLVLLMCKFKVTLLLSPAGGFRFYSVVYCSIMALRTIIRRTKNKKKGTTNAERTSNFLGLIS